mgnify:CR=1 FL=1
MSESRITPEQLQNLRATYPGARLLKFDDLDVVLRVPTCAEADALERKRQQGLRSDAPATDKGRAELLGCVVFPEPVHNPKGAGTAMEYAPAPLLLGYLSDFPRTLEVFRKHFRELGGQSDPAPGPPVPEELRAKYGRRALTVRVGSLAVAGRLISEGEYNDEDDRAERENGGVFDVGRMSALARTCLTQRLGDDGSWQPMSDADWARVPYAAQLCGLYLLRKAEGQVIAVEGK